MTHLRWTVLIIGLLLTAGCAKPPYQELDAAEFMLARARALQAPAYAPTEFQAAYDALQDARDAMQNYQYGDAEDSLAFALQHARRAITLTQEAKASETAAREARQQAVEAARREAEAARREQAAAKPVEVKPTPVVRPKPSPQPSPPEPATSYEVGAGETLWTIAAQPVVYGDGFLWPLLYQANRDQIKDPRQIYPGQVLNIRRDLTAEEQAEARQKARESEIFPIPPQ